VFLVLSPWQALAFVAIQQCLFGLYMGASFAPNHKAMPILCADDKIEQPPPRNEKRPINFYYYPNALAAMEG
jgi:hypothetical protein